jgi:hypothetical protein
MDISAMNVGAINPIDLSAEAALELEELPFH